MQKPCGAVVVGAVPDPGCFDLGGTAYRLTATDRLDRLIAGVALASDDVLVNDQTRMSVEVPVPGVQTVPESH